METLVIMVQRMPHRGPGQGTTAIARVHLKNMPKPGRDELETLGFKVEFHPSYSRQKRATTMRGVLSWMHFFLFLSSFLPSFFLVPHSKGSSQVRDQIWAAGATYASQSCSNAGSLTHCARLGIQENILLSH